MDGIVDSSPNRKNQSAIKAPIKLSSLRMNKTNSLENPRHSTEYYTTSTSHRGKIPPHPMGNNSARTAGELVPEEGTEESSRYDGGSGKSHSTTRNNDNRRASMSKQEARKVMNLRTSSHQYENGSRVANDQDSDGAVEIGGVSKRTSVHNVNGSFNKQVRTADNSLEHHRSN